MPTRLSLAAGRDKGSHGFSTLPTGTSRTIKDLSKILFLCFLLIVSSLPRVHAAEVSGISLPATINVSGQELRLNGKGVLKEFLLVNVYVAGLYLKHPTTRAEAAISSDEAKRMVVHMQHDVSREKFVQALEKSFTRNSGHDMPALRARLDRLEHALPSLKAGDTLEFTYLPDSGTTMRCQDRELKIAGKDFAAALFSIWLGAKPVSSTLKRELLGQAGS